MSKGRVLWFILLMGFDSSVRGWSSVQGGPFVSFGFRSRSTCMSNISVLQLIVVNDLFSSVASR